MTAPGGNFFSKSSRRAAKQATDPDLQKDMDLVDQPMESKQKTSGFQTVHYDPPGTEARRAVEGAEREVEKKHGKMKK